ncbi:hypothetical protein MPSI1_002836 [Malassezia psittaci]|uniref:Uncharacterized protein n=1 Tax=Malassezia psittaci TaxID=1821823 RepID=A0AAF0F896_9BASI|nr:hypothetical protein MPSI1_002836 [Malassezia psittaci]
MTDVFQSRTPPRSATRTNTKRSTPERRRSREASSMKIGNEIYSGESINENSDARNAALTPRKRSEPEQGCPNSGSETNIASQSEASSEARDLDNQANHRTLSAKAAESSKALEEEQEQSIQISSTDPVQELQELQPQPFENTDSHAEAELVAEDKSNSNANNVMDTDSKTSQRDSESPSSSFNSDARRRLFGKPQRKAAPYTSRMAGLTRTSRIPPLHTHRKSPPPAKRSFVTNKPAVQKPVNSDEEPEPEPEVDYENEGFL